ncbi:MAG TPA: type II toxin-antitoxin system VapC family toxin [Gammaproteobacteria bacterium]|nr:type II toxin-antitoxin system VapC family toxin [Gammaproteobacteria bacterium]
MNGVLIDSCVLLDLFTNDVNWADWSEITLEKYSQTNTLYINSIVYTEVSIGFERIEDVENVLDAMGVRVLELPREALFLTGKVYLKYRKNKGIRASPLSDFFIGAHASVSRLGLVTRDVARYKSYFPRVNLIHPYENY